ncbi:hypothetical protein ACIBEA_24000 [Streptomyces sp. NPDC051555]|uniref:hypothetical protein n=1 Tax=Streptomyces sp. NPDC051555 TaxID=3365657 RepID=UPI003789F71A
MRATFRTAAVAAGALTALALPVGAAVAAEAPTRTGPAAPAPQPTATTTVTPKGPVRAGAEGVGVASSSTTLIAGSAGMAAVGAAGLGFAMLRRGRSSR